MRYRIYPSDSKEWFLLDTLKDQIMLRCGSLTILEETCDRFNQSWEWEKKFTKVH